MITNKAIIKIIITILKNIEKNYSNKMILYSQDKRLRTHSKNLPITFKT